MYTGVLPLAPYIYAFMDHVDYLDSLYEKSLLQRFKFTKKQWTAAILYLFWVEAL